MSLGYEVLRYVDRALRDPTSAGDPRLLHRLATYAKEAFEGIVALHAPVSPMSWELNTFLDGTVFQTQRNSFRFPRPVEIVGFFSTLVIDPSSDEDLLTPSLDVIAVQIDTDNQAYLTSADGISTIAGGKAGSFVTLAAMDVQVPRLVGYKLRNPTPDIGFTYRWKVPPDFLSTVEVPSTAVYKSCLISTCMYARYI
jgi:hypothetical protein